MKQTVEEAAMNFANYESNNLDKLPFKVKTLVDYDNGLTRGFKAGAEWQAKQSPWISVKEKEPIINKPILAMLGGKVVIITFSGWDSNEGCHPFITHWMPIPSFDEILEANKDVLERIKEKEVNHG